MIADRKLMSAAAPLWYWMNERHSIWVNRSRGEKPPWTKDKTLQTYRFCNVYRELDTTTEWIRTNWREPMGAHRDLWFAMVVARVINHVPTLRALGPPRVTKSWLDETEQIFKLISKSGEQMYGAAYIITAGGRSGPKWKYTMKCLRVIAQRTPLFPYLLQGSSIFSMWDDLRHLPGCGPFVAYEIATDLRWTRYYNKTDHMTWANPGPGAVRGLNRIINGDADKPFGKRDDYISMMGLLTRMANAHKKLIWMPRFEIRDIEHSLCETDKMLRADTGEGRPKQLYRYQDVRG